MVGMLVARFNLLARVFFARLSGCPSCSGDVFSTPAEPTATKETER